MTENPEIYFSTVLLEKNRWGSREPSLLVSDWMAKIQEGGFDGLELWENHLLKAGPDELEKVLSSSLPVKILNTYCDFDNESTPQREASAQLANKLGVSGVKFNFGNNLELIDQYRDNLLQWIEMLPQGCRMLCECHPYTVLEDRAQAQKILTPLMDKIEIIVHPFGGNREGFQELTELWGQSITHIHVAGGGEEGFRYSPLASSSKVSERISMLKEVGSDCTWTIEFCAGVASKAEVMEELLKNASLDAQVLREKLQ
jgi:sugar phosphate isomerase/epimerase